MLRQVRLACQAPAISRYSHLLAGLLHDARLTIFLDSAHGFLFQRHSRFAADVHAFLSRPA
jgi:hypothetical protein